MMDDMFRIVIDPVLEPRLTPDKERENDKNLCYQLIKIYTAKERK